MMKLRLKKIFLKLVQVDTCSRGNGLKNHKTHFILLDFWKTHQLLVLALNLLFASGGRCGVRGTCRMKLRD